MTPQPSSNEPLNLYASSGALDTFGMVVTLFLSDSCWIDLRRRFRHSVNREDPETRWKIGTTFGTAELFNRIVEHKHFGSVMVAADRSPAHLDDLLRGVMQPVAGYLGAALFYDALRFVRERELEDDLVLTASAGKSNPSSTDGVTRTTASGSCPETFESTSCNPAESSFQMNRRCMTRMQQRSFGASVTDCVYDPFPV